MSRKLRRHLSVANVLSITAVFIAIGGTGYAALTLPKNSVGSKQIKRQAVKSSDVKNGTLKPVDFRAGTLLQGETGPQGLQGPQGTPGAAGAPGANGSADAYARIQPDGTLLPRIGEVFPVTNKVIQQENIEKPAAGIYCIKGLPFNPASGMVASDNAGAAAATDNDVVLSVATERGNTLNGCATDPPTQVRVVATDISAAANADKGFVIWLEAE